MANTNPEQSTLTSMDYHSDIFEFYLDSVESSKENVQYPNGYSYSPRSMQPSRETAGVQLGNSFTHFEYPLPHINQTNWIESQNIQYNHTLNRLHPYNLQEVDSRPAPPRSAQLGLPRDPWDPAHAELLNARVAAALPLQPLSVKQPIIDSDYNNDHAEILDLDSVLFTYQGCEAEKPKTSYNLIQIHTHSQDGEQVISYSDKTSNWPYGLPASSALPPINTKTADWKSKGARRPKTFNCTACKKWFTSSGHLKRHYSTTIHKNAVRTSGQPDPAAASVPHRRRGGCAGARTPPSPNLTQTTLAPHTLPQYTPLYSGQNFQQHMTRRNHPNATVREITDDLGNSPNVAKPDLSSETSPETVDVVEQGSFSHSADGQLPSFAQLQAWRYGTVASKGIHCEDSLASGEEVISTCVPLNGYMAGEKTKHQLQIFEHEPAAGAEREIACDTSVSLSLSPPAAPAPHECRACGKRFSRACYLTQHNNSSHSGARPFKCARCGKRFADEAAHARHGARHVGRKPFVCGACPKSFNHKTDLRRHMCLHAAGKPFACALCGKGFVRRDHMLKHVNTHAKRGARAPTASSSSSSSSSSAPTPPSSWSA